MQTRQKKKRLTPLHYFIAGCAVTILLLSLGAGLYRCAASAEDGTTINSAPTELQAAPEDTQAASAPSREDPLLLLVNRDNALPDGYQPALTALHDWPYSVAAAAYPDLCQMLADGLDQGLHFTIASAYRSVEYQEELFDEDVLARMDEGMSYQEAWNETARYTMPPGCSEHSTGLALDIVSTDYQRLDEGQESTPETQWLHENCWKYGFILRYPKDKTDVTGIDYESWHYRYVGREAACWLTENGLTLEEFWGSTE